MGGLDGRGSSSAIPKSVAQSVRPACRDLRPRRRDKVVAWPDRSATFPGDHGRHESCWGRASMTTLARKSTVVHPILVLVPSMLFALAGCADAGHPGTPDIEGNLENTPGGNGPNGSCLLYTSD